MKLKKLVAAMALVAGASMAGPTWAVSIIPDDITVEVINTADGSPTTDTGASSQTTVSGGYGTIAPTTTSDTTTDTTTTSTISYTDDVVVPTDAYTVVSSSTDPDTGVITTTVSYDDGTGTLQEMTVVSTPSDPVLTEATAPGTPIVVGNGSTGVEISGGTVSATELNVRTDQTTINPDGSSSTVMSATGNKSNLDASALAFVDVSATTTTDCDAAGVCTTTTDPIFNGGSALSAQGLVVVGADWASGAAVSAQGLAVVDADGNGAVVSAQGLGVMDAAGNVATYDATGMHLTNSATGHTTGLTVTDTATTLSGGTGTTTMTLDDAGAHFETADPVTGAPGPTLITGVADGVNANDAVNKGQLDTEATTRAAADTTLQTNIDTEAATRSTADTALQDNIDTEATTRAAADTAFQDNINMERNARTEADDELKGGVALAIAAASHQYDVSYNGLQMSAAGGFYDGESAVSLGMGGQVGKVFVNANVGVTSQSKTAGGVAVGFKF